LDVPKYEGTSMDVLRLAVRSRVHGKLIVAHLIEVSFMELEGPLPYSPLDSVLNKRSPEHFSCLIFLRSFKYCGV
jgi:hypothetical protein